MGISTGSKSGSARSEINVTPLVDVVLVLLIIFLVTMPIMMKQVMLKVPRKLQENEEQPTHDKSYSILLCSGTTRCGAGDVIISDGEKDQPSIKIGELGGALKPIVDGMKNEKLLFVDYCDGMTWDHVVASMDQILSIAKMTDDVAAGSKNIPDIKIALKMREKKASAKDDEDYAVDSEGCPCDPDASGLHPCSGGGQ